ncbi:MAG: aminoacetone oxidase family FAD-binding enzyme, partial [Candidatus Binatia bacterium]
MPRLARLQGARRAAEDQAELAARLRSRASGDREVATRSFDVIVLGGGAAGLFCAIEAGKRGRRVAVVEGQPRVGRKIEISGGGRCNFTNRVVGAEHFLSENPDFARSALARYGPDHFIALVDRYGIAWHEKTLGQLFCDGSSRQVIDLLVAECRDAGVEIRVGQTVTDVTRDGRFAVDTDGGRLEAESLVVATGGLSIPKLGASDLGYRLASRFGLRVVAPRPGLVPFRFAADDLPRWGDLAGVSFPTRVRVAGERAEFREAGLFTHRGLSGPAFLQISSYWREGRELVVDFAPDRDIAGELLAARDRSIELANFLAGVLPRRLALRWCELHGGSRPLRSYSPAELESIAAHLRAWTVGPATTEGFA